MSASLKSRRAHFAFALWAIHQPKVPKVREIMALTGVNEESARQWRNDWIDARMKAFLKPEDLHAR
jgi:hypothetical protein